MIRILLIEDNEVTAQFLSAVLKREGYDCIIAKNSAEAETAVGTYEFDLIITDMMLGSGETEPESGVAVKERLENMGIDVPFIGISAYPYSSGARLAYGAGMVGFLAKPISNILLKEAIEGALHGRDN